MAFSGNAESSGVTPTARRAWRWLHPGLATLAAVLALAHARGVQGPPVSFGREVSPPTRTAAGPLCGEEMVCLGTSPTVHAPSIAELPGGRLVVAWYGGRAEGASDVAIFLATRASGAARWSDPRAVVTREGAERETRRHIANIGNAVLFSRGARLWLAWVSTALGGWSTAQVNLTSSDDGGASWASSRRLVTSPLLGFGASVKNPPLALDGGAFALPASLEAAGHVAEMLWLWPGAGGEVAWRTTRLTGGGSHQPALVPRGRRDAVALLRPASPGDVGLVATADGGASWGGVASTGVANPASGLCAVALSDGRILLASNQGSGDRSVLALVVSADVGVTWRQVAVVERAAGEELSYPFLLRSRDGPIHLVYTWKRRGIKHVTLDERWIDDPGGRR